MQGAALQGEDGNQPELVGETLPGFLIGAQLQHQGVPALVHKAVLHETGKAVLAGLVGLALGLDFAVNHLAAVGEQNGGVIAPNFFVRLPHMLHAVAFAPHAFDLRA